MPNYIFKGESNKELKIGKLVCLARTYKKHAEEMQSKVPDDPILFLKPTSSVIFNGDSIIYPKQSNCLHHEVELGVVIGKKCKYVSKEEALDYVLGYCVCLDITARDIKSELKKKGYPWSIAKGFDTFAPISDVILKEEVKNPNNLDMWLKVNDVIKQKTNTNNMIFSVEQIIEFISKIMTLLPGDLIMTGTPEGVGEIKLGDTLKANLENLCSISINVK